jgi:hypothetical protein
MEKLVYVLWKRGDEPNEAFKQRLLEETGPRLLALEIERLRISVVDDDVAAGEKLRLGRMSPPKAAFVSCWIEQSQDRAPVERVLAGTCGAFAGYLVVESRPLVNRTARAGARTPGFALVTCIEPADGLAYAEFLRIWHEQQRACAIETQSTFGYVRNEIVRALTPNAPKWAAIVEENFPLAALSDSAAFYDAASDPAKLKRNLKRMLDTCQGFLAQDRVESHPMSEYVLS